MPLLELLASWGLKWGTLIKRRLMCWVRGVGTAGGCNIEWMHRFLSAQVQLGELWEKVKRIRRGTELPLINMAKVGRGRDFGSMRTGPLCTWVQITARPFATCGTLSKSFVFVLSFVFCGNIPSVWKVYKSEVCNWMQFSRCLHPCTSLLDKNVKYSSTPTGSFIPLPSQSLER
jgi:hypothetical protein